MIAIIKSDTAQDQIDNLVAWLENQGLKIHISQGDVYTVLGLVGDTSKIDMELLESLEIVKSVKRISEPYKRVSRDFEPANSVIEIGEAKVKIGGGHFAIMAGPCSVESEEQIIGIAKAVKASGANLLRGGAFKPRTSPYDFQGHGAYGLDLLRAARAETGLPIVTELMNINHIPLFEDVDMIQIGARNMQNFDLLKEVGKLNKPILLKRGLSSTMKEWLMSAEYIMSEGNEKVILCERGIRTFETYTRNTLDLSCVPLLKQMSHLPIVVDPSHATGIAKLVKSMSLAATAAGADGLMIEVHNDPAHAYSDGAQSLTPEQFDDVAKGIFKIYEVMKK